MRKTILICGLIILATSSCNVTSGKKTDKNNDSNSSERMGPKKKKNTESYVTVFYNTENLFDIINDPNINDDDFTPSGFKNWTKERYKDKLDKLSWVLSNIEDQFPVLIGLCEVENKTVLKDLINTENLKDNNYGIVHENSPDKRGIDVALLYDKSRFTYISHESFSTELVDYKVRDILYVKGYFNKADTFHIFVNHWKSRRQGKQETEHMRIASAEVLKKKIDKIFDNEKDARIIIMGDFNDEPNDKSLQEVLTATNKKYDLKDRELYNLMYDLFLEGNGSYSRNYEWNMLDNLIVSKSLINGSEYNIKELTGHIYKPDEILFYNSKADMKVPNKTYGGKNYYGGYSDHLPVYFILEKID